MKHKLFQRLFLAVSIMLICPSGYAASHQSSFSLDTWNHTAILTGIDNRDLTSGNKFTVPTVYKDNWNTEYRVIGVAKAACNFNKTVTEVNFDEGCEKIEICAFADCDRLRRIRMPQSLLTIDDQIVWDCHALAELVIPKNVEKCGQNLLWGTPSLMSIQKVAYPMHISDPFANLNLPDLAKIVYDADDVCFDGDIIYNGDKSKIIFVPYDIQSFEIPQTVTEIGDYAFANCHQLERISLPVSVVKIGKGAFKNCEKLISVNLPASLTEIGDETFCNCKSLQFGSLSLADTLTSVGNKAFYCCENLKAVILPEYLLHLGSNAFYGCSGLTDVTYLALDPKSFGTNVFDGNCSGHATLHIQKDAFERIKASDTWKIFGTFDTVDTGDFLAMGNGGYYFNFTVVDDIEHTCQLREGYSLAGAVSPYTTDYLVVPSRVTHNGNDYTVVGVGDRAFYNIASESISLPGSIKYIGDDALAGCNKLRRIVIPANIEEIGERAFSRCTGISAVEYYTYNPIAASSDIFAQEVYEHANLTVPSTALQTFIDTTPWGFFRKINNLEAPSIIDTTTADSFIETIYDINGIRMNRPFDELPHGIYIIVQSTASRYCDGVIVKRSLKVR